jgi:alkanesulfonate monooxygenase SsuD/methylene tetrahydromethanopterin reductase-like flavin-dependent oxidoreductase (luciferase family)
MGLQLTGEIGDGAILSIFNTPGYVRFAWDRVKEGADKVGKSLEDFEMVSYLPMVIDDDLDRAFGFARDLMKLYVPHSQPNGPLMKHAGITSEDTLSFQKAEKQGKDVGELLTDKMVLALGVVGNVESCIKQLQELIDAGANTLVAFPVPGTDPVKTAKVLAKDIAPHLR